MQFILLGLVGEYIGKIFLQVRGRTGYLPLEDDSQNDYTGERSAPIVKDDKVKYHRQNIPTSEGQKHESFVSKESRHPP